MSKLLGVAGTASIASIGAAYTKGYLDSRAKGRVPIEARLAGLSSAAEQAATPLVNGTALATAARFGTPAVRVAAATIGKAVLPASMAMFAAKYAATQYKDTHSIADAAKAAGYGAVNAIIPIDLIKDTAFALKRRKAAVEIAKAEKEYGGTIPTPLRGWANPNVQKAAQRARAAKKGRG